MASSCGTNHTSGRKGKPYMIDQMYGTGIKTLDNLLSDMDEVLTLAELCDKYHMSINWLDYHGLLSAIPKRWLRIIKEGRQCMEMYLNKYEQCKNAPKASAMAYKMLISQPCIFI